MMSAFWIAPLGLAALALAWGALQRAWVRHMQWPADSDALARGGCADAGCGGDGCAGSRGVCGTSDCSRRPSCREDSRS